jgi:hypothetical protein
MVKVKSVTGYLNHLLEMVNQEYKGHPEQLILLNGRNVCNQVSLNQSIIGHLGEFVNGAC